MLRTIPAQILRSTATVRVCTGTDMYQNQTYGEEYTLRRVHLQPTKQIIKAKDNTDLQLTSVLFVDCRISSPAIDWAMKLQSAHDLGGDIRVIVRGIGYTVAAVDLLRDNTDRPHHWEISLY